MKNLTILFICFSVLCNAGDETLEDYANNIYLMSLEDEYWNPGEWVKEGDIFDNPRNYGGKAARRLFREVSSQYIVPRLAEYLRLFHMSMKEQQPFDRENLKFLLEIAGGWRQKIAAVTQTSASEKFGVLFPKPVQGLTDNLPHELFPAWRWTVIQKMRKNLIEAFVENPHKYTDNDGLNSFKGVLDFSLKELTQKELDTYKETIEGDPYSAMVFCMQGGQLACGYQHRLLSKASDLRKNFANMHEENDAEAKVEAIDDYIDILETFSQKKKPGATCRIGKKIYIQSEFKCNHSQLSVDEIDGFLLAFQTALAWTKNDDMDIFTTALGEMAWYFSHSSTYKRGQAAISLWNLQSFAWSKGYNLDFSHKWESSDLNCDQRALMCLTLEEFLPEFKANVILTPL